MAPQIPEVPIVEAGELAAELAGPNPPRLLDVREAHELAICTLSPCEHVPLGALPARLGDLDPDADWVVICRTGNRSGHATTLLRSRGFARVRNLAGGLHAWSRVVDPSMPTY